MTAPVSNANGSYYDPTVQLSSADERDATSVSCGAPAEVKPPIVTIQPVVITGDAGAQGLRPRYDCKTQ